ncbi:MAG: LptF/LptG family permease [Paludibacteraceae bacterium]|nr:LptF/LptG family permease [Paludibacteraceae bacterium]
MHIKRLYLFLIKSYLGTFIATFFICLFIVLMQFLWKYVDDMVGKGLEISVLAQFFYYAALSLIPMALPLSILLSSLMTFGNFGERLELLAMKAAGISLFRIMRPFVVFIILVSIGAFFFSNNAMPVIQTKMYTLLRSIKDKKPDAEIPTGSFYNGVPGYSIYVAEKDEERHLLKNVMIYDFSDGFENAVVMAADSARLMAASDKMNLVLDLYSGESFENLKNQKEARNSVPYRRETFSFKEVLIEFDSNFKMQDVSIASNKYMTKNIQQLTLTIDSLTTVIDSMNTSFIAEYKGEALGRTVTNFTPVSKDSLMDYKKYNVDSLWIKLQKDQKLDAMNSILFEANNTKNDLLFQQDMQYANGKVMRKHDIERHRKYTLSFACLVFFFIGAPLGAIIRKGGLGMPVVISVLLFVIYYVIDNMGYKTAREGVWHIWSGIWLSTGVLFPFGVLLTYQAATDRIVSISDMKLIKWVKSLIIKKKEEVDNRSVEQIIEDSKQKGRQIDNK